MKFPLTDSDTIKLLCETTYMHKYIYICVKASTMPTQLVNETSKKGAIVNILHFFRFIRSFLEGRSSIGRPHTLSLPLILGPGDK